MSKASWAQTDDKMSATADLDAPAGQIDDKSYATGSQREPIPVLGDDEPVEDPVDESKADSDQQLERDDHEAIDKSNIMQERTRGAEPTGSYVEPSDEELGLEE